MRRWFLVAAGIALVAACSDGVSPKLDAPTSSTGLRLLGTEAEDGFARATEPRGFEFPADHGSHPEFRTEWWYFTGNLATAEGRHFGFELTFFRYALAPPSPTPQATSAWRADQVWMAHFAITDTEGKRFVARERLTREALGLAGAAAEPLEIWVEDWSATGEARGDELRVRLGARDDVIALSLSLAATVPHVAQGNRGLDVKGAGTGNASHYYSVPRLAADGEVNVAGETFSVTGVAWLDREWSTSSLDPGTVGWDWFALRLSNGSDLMFYRLRTAAGEASPYSGGTLVTADGKRTPLGAEDVALTAIDQWTSRATGVRYPVAWRLAVPELGIELEIEPYLESQELALSVRYWEGAVHAAGRDSSGPLTAEGYLELAGYQ
ncbi:MAG TPA: lipocalin-like domain-containing protein [Gammaproteobacteria bacterium]|nr:lipocalin-like domain-containing protein [Gammaproteobacteria bacterium]